jgi:membrane protein implicated in regulation of membrane protease activity
VNLGAQRGTAFTATTGADRTSPGAAGIVNEGSDMELGAKFWLAIVGGAIACGFAAILALLLIGTAWARWGFFGMFLVLSAILLLFGWLVDRREKKRYGSTT